MIHLTNFSTQPNEPQINKNNRTKHNLFKIISYIPIVSAIPAIYKIFIVAKTCLSKLKPIEINIDDAFKKMIEGFRNDIKSQNAAAENLSVIGQDLLNNIKKFDSIDDKISLQKNAGSNFDINLLTQLNNDYKEATKEFYRLINKPFTPPKEYPIQLFIKALKNNENVSKAKNITFKQLALTAFRAFVFEIAPIGWTLIPVDLFTTYCCKHQPVQNGSKLRF